MGLHGPELVLRFGSFSTIQITIPSNKHPNRVVFNFLISILSSTRENSMKKQGKNHNRALIPMLEGSWRKTTYLFLMRSQQFTRERTLNCG